jgi:hypothetical protein
MRTVEAAMGSGLRAAGQHLDQLQIPEAGADAQVDRLSTQQCGNLAIAPEQRRNQRRATVAAGEEVGARARCDHQPCKLAVVRIAGLMQLRPPVVVPSVRVGSALEQERDDLVRASHPEQIVAVRPALHDQIREAIEQMHEPAPVGRLDRLIRQHTPSRREKAARAPDAQHRLSASASSRSPTRAQARTAPQPA